MFIDHSSAIVHIKQSGLQCWVRSSQMAFSWILREVGFTQDQIEEIFFQSLFPKSFFDSDQFRLKKIKDFNQRGLGRRLRAKEELELSIDTFFVKVYSEFGSTSFAPETFTSIITAWFNVLGSFNPFFLKNYEISLVFDNDKPIEHHGYIQFTQFREIKKILFKTGCFLGEDKEFWDKLSSSDKKKIILACLEFSPVLIETPGHALLLSGYDPLSDMFLLNDSMQIGMKKIDSSQFLKNLATIVMFFKITQKI